MKFQLEQLVHGAAKQTTATSPSATTATTQPQGNETRAAPANEAPATNNAEAMNQLSTAPPGTGPPPSLNETQESSTPPEVSQANGKLLI